MKMKDISLIIAMVSIFVAPGIIFSQAQGNADDDEIQISKQDNIELGITLESLSGRYQNKLRYGGLRKRMKWPLDSTLIGPTLKFYTQDGYVKIDYRTNITDKPGEAVVGIRIDGNDALREEVGTKLTFHRIGLMVGRESKEEGFSIDGERGLLLQYIKWEGSGFLTQQIFPGGSEIYGLPPGTYRLGPEDWVRHEIYNLSLPYNVFFNYRFSEHFLLRGTGRLLIGFLLDSIDYLYVQEQERNLYLELGAGAGIEAEFRYEMFKASLSALYTYHFCWTSQRPKFYWGMHGPTYHNVTTDLQSQQLYLGAKVGVVF